MRSIILESLDDFQEYKEDWEGIRKECGAPIFSSYDLVHLWLDNYKAVVKPYIILIEDNGELVGAAPMFSSHIQVMGMHIDLKGMVGNMNTLVGYSLFRVFAKQDNPAIVTEMLNCVKRAKWDTLILTKMDTNRSTMRFLDEIAQRGEGRSSSLNESIDRSYVFPVEGNITANFGRTTRKNLQNARNKLERQGRMDFRKVDSVQEAESAMHLYLTQHDERWEHRNSYLRGEANHRLVVELGKLAVRTGNGEINEVLIDGEVAGQLLCFFDGDVSRAFRVGMTDRFQDFSPGKMALVLTMEDNRKRGIKAMDFLHGNEEYKLHMTNIQHALRSEKVYRGTWKAIFRVRSSPPMKFLENHLKFQDHIERRLCDT